MSGDDDYRMRHRPPGKHAGAPLHDLTANGIYPEDVYDHPEWYTTGREELEGHRIARRVRHDPDAFVTMYRAVPCEVKRTIRKGDWVTTSRAYAIRHGRHYEDPDFDMCVLSAETHARCLVTDGNSLAEYGFVCPDAKATLSYDPTS